MSDRQIHINSAGQQYGPYPEATAREMLAAGQLLATDLAWIEGAEEWKPLGETLGATAAPPPPPAPPKPPGGDLPERTVAGSPLTGQKTGDGEPDDPDIIHVTRKGQPIGPYSRDKAREYFKLGQLLPTDWGWHIGMGEEWKPLSELLSTATQPPATPPPPPPAKSRKSTWTYVAGSVQEEGTPASKNYSAKNVFTPEEIAALKKNKRNHPKWIFLLLSAAVAGAVFGFFIAKISIDGLDDIPWFMHPLGTAANVCLYCFFPETPFSRWTTSIVLWLPQKILGRTINVAEKKWTLTVPLECDWKMPLVLVILVEGLAGYGCYSLVL